MRIIQMGTTRAIAGLRDRRSRFVDERQTGLRRRRYSPVAALRTRSTSSLPHSAPN
jgi:hypothetical protein